MEVMHEAQRSHFPLPGSVRSPPSGLDQRPSIADRSESTLLAQPCLSLKPPHCEGGFLWVDGSADGLPPRCCRAECQTILLFDERGAWERICEPELMAAPAAPGYAKRICQPDQALLVGSLTNSALILARYHIV